MLHIDEVSGTLKAPDTAALVREDLPESDELLTLISSSWEIFAAELGLSGVQLLAHDPVASVDLLGLDERNQRVVVILVTSGTIEWHLGRALAAAADVSGWDRGRLAAIHPGFDAIREAAPPALLLIAGGYDARALATLEWLSSTHTVPISAYTVDSVRFGRERLLSVRRENAADAMGDPMS